MAEEKKDEIVAEVDEVAIHRSDVEALRQLLANQGQTFEGQDGFNRLRDELIHQELLYRDALDRNYDKDPEFVLRLEESKRQLLQQYALQKLFSEVSVKEEDLRQYYQAHKDRLKSYYTFNCDHILVDHREQAEELKQRLDQGEIFEDLAKKYSQCPSKANGGNLGDFPSGTMVKEFEEALMTLEEGEISQPVKTNFGYHIIRLNRKTKHTADDFDAVKEQLGKEFTLLKQQEHYVNRLNEIEKKHQVTRK